MQLLFILVLIYCSDFIFLQNISNKDQFEKLDTVKSKKNIALFNSSTSITNCIHKCSMHGVKRGQLALQWTMQEASKQCFLRQRFSVQTRKLLDYPSKPLYQNPTKSARMHGSNVRFHKEEQRDILRDIEKSTESHILWDDWGNWSPCSVTCGNGRLVRWRHCSGGNCSKGLKKAQIKTCHLKPCQSKNILNWFGLKGR